MNGNVVTRSFQGISLSVGTGTRGVAPDRELPARRQARVDVQESRRDRREATAPRPARGSGRAKASHRPGWPARPAPSRPRRRARPPARGDATHGRSSSSKVRRPCCAARRGRSTTPPALRSVAAGAGAGTARRPGRRARARPVRPPPLGHPHRAQEAPRLLGGRCRPAAPSRACRAGARSRSRRSSAAAVGEPVQHRARVVLPCRQHHHRALLAAPARAPRPAGRRTPRSGSARWWPRRARAPAPPASRASARAPGPGPSGRRAPARGGATGATARACRAPAPRARTGSGRPRFRDPARAARPRPSPAAPRRDSAGRGGQAHQAQHQRHQAREQSVSCTRSGSRCACVTGPSSRVPAAA